MIFLCSASDFHSVIFINHSINDFYMFNKWFSLSGNDFYMFTNWFLYSANNFYIRQEIHIFSNLKFAFCNRRFIFKNLRFAFKEMKFIKLKSFKSNPWMEQNIYPKAFGRMKDLVCKLYIQSVSIFLHFSNVFCT